jgi:hypothetical protein
MERKGKELNHHHRRQEMRELDNETQKEKSQYYQLEQPESNTARTFLEMR